MAWLIPFSSLTPAQQDAVQMDTRTHKAIVGGPGAGKTLVLLHRLNLLFHRAGKNSDAIRLFVYTNTLKQFIQAGKDMLDVPDECISTFDKWCSDAYKEHVDRQLPRMGGMPDFDAIRAGVFSAIDSGKLPTPLFDCVLIDEAQDMDIGAIEILKRLARHITLCMDGKQQLYDGRMSEPEALTRLGLTHHDTALLASLIRSLQRRQRSPVCTGPVRAPNPGCPGIQSASIPAAPACTGDRQDERGICPVVVGR
jgi:superfamily I DNA/RNA helicase